MLVAVTNRAAPKFKHRIADYYKKRGVYVDGNEDGMIGPAYDRIRRSRSAALRYGLAVTFIGFYGRREAEL